MRIKALVLTLVLIVLVHPTTIRLRSQSNAAEDLKAFIDDFVGADRPGGGGPGVGRDMSAAAFVQQLDRTKQQLARLRAIDHARLTGDDLIDWRFAESILVGRELAQERIQAWKKDPRVYMAFSDLSATLERPGDPASKVDEVLAMLKLIPVQLDNGRKNIEVYVPRFQELSVFMAKGASDLFDKDVVRFADQVTGSREEILAVDKKAGETLRRYIWFLENELPRRPRGEFAIGTATYDAMLKGQYLLPYDSESLYRFGWNEFDRTVRELEKVAREIDPKRTWQELATEIKNEGPDPTREIEAHQEWVNKARSHILAKNLIPIPWKERVDVVPREEYLRKTSYYGNFSMPDERSPEPDGTLVGQWQINPFDLRWDPLTKHDYIVEHDWGVIIVTAAHETYRWAPCAGPLSDAQSAQTAADPEHLDLHRGLGPVQRATDAGDGILPERADPLATTATPSVAQRPGHLRCRDTHGQAVLRRGRQAYD